MRLVQGRLLSVCVLVVVGLVMAFPGAHALARQDSVGIVADDMAALMEEGQVIFGSTCVACHDAEGGPTSAPALSGHPSMGVKDHIVRQVLRGNVQKGMPPFASTLGDRQVAAVTTYIRNAWDNSYGIVSEADSKRVRAESDQKR